MILAIDGPAGSGKSTTARRAARELGWLYLDTGAMYRAVGVAFQDRGAAFTDAAAADVLDALDLDVRPGDDGVRVFLGGDDVTARIRTPEASEVASRVSALPLVRERMVEIQRRIARAADGVVMEGRDIGTVVFPDAEVKVFLTADPAARAERRHAELAARGDAASVADVQADLAARDARDAQRAVAPLRQAEDAVVLDTTGLGIEEQVAAVVRLVRERQARNGSRSQVQTKQDKLSGV